VERYIWAGPASAIGLLLAVLSLRRGRIVVRGGVLEAHGAMLRWLLTHAIPLRGGAAAITFGHVVLARSAEALDATRAHERVHVRQYERWGPFFIPAYLAAGAWAWARGGHFYFDNLFERQADRACRHGGLSERAEGS
jgi:hypothetical protein